MEAGGPPIEKLFASNDVAALLAAPAEAGADETLARALKPLRYKAPLALRLAERLIDEGTPMPLERGLQLELDHLPEIFGSADAYEGLSSVGKRKPSFQGK